MMNVLLKYLQVMPLTLNALEAFMYRAARLVIIGELRMDDWVYLAHLIAYRTTTRLNASDKERAVMVSLLRGIDEDKKRLSNMFN